MAFVRFFLIPTFLLVAISANAAETQRALFVSMIQDPPALGSRESIDELIDFAKENRFQILFVQVHRENKSWFPSKVADDALYRKTFKTIGSDPLKILIKQAHAQGLEVHAWVNLMSLGANEKAPLLKKYGNSILTRSQKPKQSLEDYKIDGQFFLEPGDRRVRKAMEDLTKEIAARYSDLDGIQFDYIRYPDWERVAPHGKKWNAWKEKQVTVLLKKLRQVAKKTNPKLKISTTGLMPYSRAHLEAYQNWRDWLETGAADFVTLMAYARTEPEFEKYLKDVNENSQKARTILGVGAYFFTKNVPGFEAQWQACEADDFKACAFFHYGNVEDNPLFLNALNAQKGSQ